MWLSFVLLLTVIALIWRELRNVYKTFENIGVKGPKPVWIFGNLLQIYRRPKGKTREQIFLDWVAEFGPVFGYFEGFFPVLFVSHPDTLQQVLQTEFQNFVNRPLRDDFEGGTRGDVFSSRGQQWKRIRSVLSPVFSAANMRHVTPLIDEKVQHLINRLRQEAAKTDGGGVRGEATAAGPGAKGENGQVSQTHVTNNDSSKRDGFDIYHLFQGLTLDVIGQAAFGMEIDSMVDDSHPFAYHCREVFLTIAKAELPFQLLRGFPTKIRMLFRRIMALAGKLLVKRKDGFQHFKYLLEASTNVVADRQANPVFFAEKPDLLGLMLEYVTDEKQTNDQKEGRDHFKGNFKKTMTVKEVSSNSWIFLLAGFETSSTALGFIAHALCQNPQIQEDLAKEIHDHEEENGGELSSDAILKLALLDQVIQEALRMYPPAPLVIRRHTTEAIQLKVPEGFVQLPQGMTVQIGVLAAHFNAKLWSQPDKFDPGRFTPEARKLLHPFQFLPFGLGPRGCVGMRFAILEIKIALAHLIKHFRMEPCSSTEVDIKFAEGATRTPKNGVWVKLSERGQLH